MIAGYWLSNVPVVFSSKWIYVDGLASVSTVTFPQTEKGIYLINTFKSNKINDSWGSKEKMKKLRLGGNRKAYMLVGGQ